MPGVQADAVTVLIEAKTARYLADMEQAAKKTEAVFARIRAQANKPVTLTANVKTSQTETREVEKNAQRKATAEEKASARAAAAAEKAAARKAAADEKAAQRSIDAANKAAAKEIAAQERIAAAVERGLARRANAAAGGAGLGGTAGSRALSARQTANMRAGTALGGSGTMPAPTPAADKVNYFLRDQIDTQGRFNAAQAAGNREEANALRDQLTQFRLINQYKRAGLDETEATARAEDRVAEIARRRANRAQATPVEAASAPTRGGGLAGAARTVRNVAAIGFAGYGAAQGAKEYLELTDAYKQYNAQLKLATAENGNLATAQNDTQRIATETRSGLAETAQLYATFQRNAGQLGLSQEQTARATETVTKAFQISGATAAEASGGLRQFLQGLQSGTLRGEEFNSVVENAPRLAKLLADQLAGGNVGALRKLAEAGKITASDLKTALTDQKFTAQIDAEFKQLPVTFDQAMTVVKNAATVTFGEFDQGGQFSTALANFITGGATGFADLGDKAADFGIRVRSTLDGLSNAFGPFLAGGNSAFDALGIRIHSVGEQIRSVLGSLDRVQNAPANFANFLNAPGNAVRGVFGGKPAPLVQGGGTRVLDYDRGKARSDARLKLDKSVRKLEALGFIVPRNADGTVDEANIQRPGARRSATFQPTAPRPVAASKSGGGSGTGRSAAAAQNKVKQQADQFDQQNANLDDALLSAKGRQVKGIEDTLASDIAQADSENAKRKERFDQFTAAQQAELNAKSDSIAAQKKITAVYDAIVATANQNAELAINEKSAAVDAKQAEIDMTIGRAARAKLEDELLDLKYEERRRQIEKNKAIAIQNGDVAGADRADKDLAQAATDRSVGKFQNKQNSRSSYQEYRDKYTATGTAESLEEVNNQIDNIKIQALDGIADSLANATTKALGLTGALGDIVGQIIKIGIQRRLIGPIADTLFGSATGGGGGALGGLFSSLFGGARASGGDVSSGKIYRINENGPEYFQPAMSGKIIPTGRAASAGGGSTIIQPQINVDARGSVMADTFAKQILARADNTAKGYAAQSGKAAYKNAPQSSRDYQQQRG